MTNKLHWHKLLRIKCHRYHLSMTHYALLISNWGADLEDWLFKGSNHLPCTMLMENPQDTLPQVRILDNVVVLKTGLYMLDCKL